MTIQEILSQIDLGSMALPEFQRGYVWNRDQVRVLMQSLYRRYPVGGMLVWVTRTESADARGDGPLAPGVVKLILDGQQRITSLYGIIKGKPPKFFEGNAQAFTGLYFNLQDETFEFYAPLKMKDNPYWINVTELMQRGVGPFMTVFAAKPECQASLTDYINRLSAVYNIREIELHIDEVIGEDKTVDVVVEIFNRVNTGGTKLSKGDLALAKICAAWPEAREEMKKRLDKWAKAGFHFKLDWFLRCINTVVTGEALFSALRDVDTQTFSQGLLQAEKAVDKVLNLISSRLGLDHGQVLGSVYSIPLMARYISRLDGRQMTHQEQDKLLYWYVHTLLWGRYAGSVESTLNQDLGAIESKDGALDRLISQLRQTRGDLRLHPDDFAGWSMGARFYPMLYMMARVCHAKDWESGVDLTNHLLGHLCRLQIHHIFPKSQLKKHGYTHPEINALANFTFLTQETNLDILDDDPAVYLEQIAKNQPGALESHWIPMDRDLWRIERYRDFLAARRELLARAANEFLDSLVAGTIPEVAIPEEAIVRPALPVCVADEEEDRLLRECNAWVVEQGLPAGEMLYELRSDEGEKAFMLDLVWPNGLQIGLSEPVAVLLNEEADVIEAASMAGYRCFTNIDSFKDYVNTEILALQQSIA